MIHKFCVLVIPLLAPAIHAQHIQFAAAFGATCVSAECGQLFATFPDTAVGVGVDAEGNSYVAGTSYGFFPLVSAIEPSPYAVQNGPGGWSIPFVAKIDPTGTKLLYATPIGAPQVPSGPLLPVGLAIDSAGNAYVTGTSMAAGFPGVGGATVAGAGGSDAFLIKLDPSGKLLLSMLFGGSGSDAGSSIAVSQSGVVFIAGTTQSSNFPVTNGALQSSLSGKTDLFLTTIDGATGKTLSSTLLGPGSGPQLALGPQGDVFVAGSTTSAAWPTTSGTVQPKCAGAACSNVIVLRFRATASQIVYATYLGGSGVDTLGGIASDSAGSLYLTGTTTSIDFPVTGTVLPAPPCADINPGACGSKVFVTHLNPLATALAYSTLVGGNAADQGNAIAIDAAGDAYVAGQTTSTNFPTVHPIQAAIPQQGCSSLYYHSQSQSLVCGAAGFLTAISPSGGSIVWSTFLGQDLNLPAGLGFNGACGVTLDSSGAIYVAGDGLAIDGTVLGPSGGDASLLKIVPGGPPLILAANSLVNSASYAPGLPAGGGLATLFVEGLTGVNGIEEGSGLPLQTSLAGVSVKVGGELAPLLAIASLPGGGQQINFQVPFGVTGFLIFPVVEIDVAGTAMFTATLPVAPGIFTLADGSAAVQHSSDFSLVTSANPVVPGEIIVIYATGLGPYTGAQAGVPPSGPAQLEAGLPRVLLAGLNCAVLYAGPAPGYVGLDQINCQTNSQPVSAGPQPLQVISGLQIFYDSPIPAFVTNSNIVNVPMK